MNKRVTKVKVKKGIYYFAWEEYQSSTTNWDAHTLTCKDKPRDELLAAMVALVPHVLDICEFDEEAWRYIMGDRAQQELAFADAEDESEPQNIGA